jgi:hypothetical protein
MAHDEHLGVGHLVDLYTDNTPGRRLPWNPALLDADERRALESLLARFVADYNTRLAVAADEVIPPCWPKHEGMAHFLAVLAWGWYSVHVDPAARALEALDFHERHLPLTRVELTRLLGRNPAQCRRGEHDDNWRKPADDLIGQTKAAPPRTNVARFGFENT